MSSAQTVTLFGSKSLEPRKVWNASDFTAIDDRVRGGSSTSRVEVDKADQQDDDKKGSLIFEGFLDTLTLGGAGFASQSYVHPLPGSSIGRGEFSGLRIIAAPIADSVSSSPVKGGGKGPVSTYTLNLKTASPQQRPDGRRESTIVYEYDFRVPAAKSDQKLAASSSLLTFDAAWDEFKPTYRGKPAENAPCLDTEKIQEWSIMARSNFGSQSGPFSLRLIALEAIYSSSSAPLVTNVMTKSERELLEAQHINQLTSSMPPANASSGSGEFYGFALFILATLVLVGWCLWALTPDRILKQIGIDYYPNREWAYLLPAWSLVAVMFAYAAFLSLNIFHTPSLDDLSTIVDTHGNYLELKDTHRDGREMHPLCDLTMAQTGMRGGPMAGDTYDLPPGIVNRERHGLLHPSRP